MYNTNENKWKTISFPFSGKVSSLLELEYAKEAGVIKITRKYKLYENKDYDVKTVWSDIIKIRAFALYPYRKRTK